MHGDDVGFVTNQTKVIQAMLSKENGVLYNPYLHFGMCLQSFDHQMNYTLYQWHLIQFAAQSQRKQKRMLYIRNAERPWSLRVCCLKGDIAWLGRASASFKKAAALRSRALRPGRRACVRFHDWVKASLTLSAASAPAAGFFFLREAAAGQGQKPVQIRARAPFFL